MTATIERALPVEGLHDDIPEQEYHADPGSLSSTGAKTILYQGPRAFQHAQANPVHKDAYDIGNVVHALILGVGDYEVLDFPDYRTKVAQQARDEAREGGKTPILPRDLAPAEAMRDAVYDNSMAAWLLGAGRPEVSLWATDPETGVLMRGRIDWLRDNAFVDVKTSKDPTDPRSYARTAWKLGYHVQAAWYQRLLRLNGLDLPPLWIAVHKTEPHETYVHQPDADMLAIGHAEVDRALHLYASCQASGRWPGLADADTIHTLERPW